MNIISKPPVVELTLPIPAYKLAQRAISTKQIVHPSGTRLDKLRVQIHQRRNPDKPLSRRDKHRLDVLSHLNK